MTLEDIREIFKILKVDDGELDETVEGVKAACKKAMADKFRLIRAVGAVKKALEAQEGETAKIAAERVVAERDDAQAEIDRIEDHRLAASIIKE